MHLHHTGPELAARAHRAAQGAHGHGNALALVAHDFAPLLGAPHPVRHHYLLQVHLVKTRFFHRTLAPLHSQPGLGRARQPPADGTGEVTQILVALPSQEGLVEDAADIERIGFGCSGRGLGVGGKATGQQAGQEQGGKVVHQRRSKVRNRAVGQKYRLAPLAHRLPAPWLSAPPVAARALWPGTGPARVL